MTHTPFFNRPTIGALPPRSLQNQRAEGQVVVANAEDELAAMLERIRPSSLGWHGILLAIPGHVSQTWQPRPIEELVHSRLRKFLSVEGIAHVYLLANNIIVVLAHEIDALLLPEVEQVLIETFRKAPGHAATYRYDLNTQLEEVRAVVKAMQERLRVAQAKAVRRAALAQQAALRFSIPATELAVRTHREHKILLLVEDDPFTAALLSGLTNHACITIVANTAAEAVKQYRAHVPDMVFLDIGLPDVSGLTLLKYIKAADAEARVIMLTANAYRDNLDKARAAGVVGFVAKPFTRSRIQQILRTL